MEVCSSSTYLSSSSANPCLDNVVWCLSNAFGSLLIVEKKPPKLQILDPGPSPSPPFLHLPLATDS